MVSDDETFQDVVDVIGLSVRRTKTVDGDDGKKHQVEEMDNKSIYYSTRIVNTSRLGQAVVAFERLEHMANIADNHTTPKRAESMKKWILDRCEEYRYGLDAKSSESQRDGKNNQDTLMHLLRKQTTKREFTAGDEKSRKLLSGFLGSREPEET